MRSMAMIDKLYLRSEREPTSLPAHPPPRRVIDKYYHDAIRYFWTTTPNNPTHELLVKLSPCFSSPYRTRFELNPSRYSSFEEVCRVISTFGIPLNELHICRIDLCADIEVPLFELKRGLWAPRKRLETHFFSCTPTGLYLGRRPDQIAVYTKKTAQLDLTRIERRQWDSKCAIQNLLDFPILAEFNPFHSLRHFEFLPREQCSASRLAAYDGLRATADLTSIAEASRRYRGQRNFSRSVLPLLRDTDIISRLHNQFRQNMNRFLSGQWTGHHEA